ncbi:MAG: glutathione S-transferase N-terminal domain-containing protein [Xanthomonadales bacterium]|nr:glutathione S-transferase N-terminal domain-containing protein [Xanthomonadales bacterium]
MTPVLVGMYDSPFVRRVAISMQIYGIDYDHQNWSVFANQEAVGRMNPLGRVPALVISDDEVLVESSAILDYLDELAGPGRALTPPSGADRRRVLQRSSMATGACEKAVAIVYETQKRAPEYQDPAWLSRLQHQLARAVGWLDENIPAFSEPLDQSQLTSAVMVRFVDEYLPGHGLEWPRLQELSRRCEATAPFQAVPFSG